MHIAQKLVVKEIRTSLSDSRTDFLPVLMCDVCEERHGSCSPGVVLTGNEAMSTEALSEMTATRF